MDSIEGDWLVKLSEYRWLFTSKQRGKKWRVALFASLTSEEITQINNEGVHEKTKKANKFGFPVFKGNGLSLSIKTTEKGFVYKCKLILRNLTCSLENQS